MNEDELAAARAYDIHTEVLGHTTNKELGLMVEDGEMTN